MSYLVIARKWRPQTFDEIIGQQHVTQTLSNAIRSNRVAHAFLFTGVRGVGKTTAARVLAKALNCAAGPTPEPCNECPNCREITAGSSVDVLEIDGASNTGVDDVREIIENVRYQPASSRYKIYIIDEVHMLSTSAFNALLKTLEEPPAHVKFIFATTDPHKVPRTIHSRCQRYDFKRIPLRLIAQQLAAITKKDGVRAEEAALLLIAREAEGSMRDAQSLLDQVLAFAGTKVSREQVVQALGLADRALVRRLSGAIVERQPPMALATLDELYSYGYDLRRLARDLLEHFRNLAAARVAADGELLAELPDEERDEILAQARAVTIDDLGRCFRILLDTEAEVARVPYPKLVFDMAVLKLSSLAPLLSADELLASIDSLARGGSDLPPSSGRPSTPAAGGSPTTKRSTGSRTAPAPASSADADFAAPPVGSGARDWPAFLEFIRTNKITLLTYLQASAVPDVSGDALTLTATRGYYFDYLNQLDHRQLIEQLASQFFGRSISLRVEAATPEAKPAAEPAPSAAELHAEAVGNPIVKAAVDILGGEIREVRPGRRPVGGDA